MEQPVPTKKPGYQKAIIIAVPSILLLFGLICVLSVPQKTATSAAIPAAMNSVAAAPVDPDADLKAAENKAAYYDRMAKQTDLEMQKQFDQEVVQKAKKDRQGAAVNSPETAEMNTAQERVQPAESYSQPSAAATGIDSGSSWASMAIDNAKTDRDNAESEMKTAMEPQERSFSTTPEGQQEAMQWHRQVMEDRAQKVSELQQRIDHDNDVLNGHGSTP